MADEMIFYVEGWGQVGYANLAGFVPFDGFKHPWVMQVGDVTEGKIQKPGSDHKPERITRVK
jgi:hypothetical protein